MGGRIDLYELRNKHPANPAGGGVVQLFDQTHSGRDAGGGFPGRSLGGESLSELRGRNVLVRLHMVKAKLFSVAL